MSKKIKNEQKKFLGETLNQYDKTLKEGIKQLDKKNREQNHKISALTNSFDNDFLEKDEEGTMISLENSKDGMVIIDEIAGNSEVNYCKDGVTELTLNGDIDTQGEASVTITEGVDGGLVDVVIEGNTEINMSNTKDPVMVTHMFDEFTNNGGKLQTTVDDVTTYDSMVGKVDIKNIKGDTLVNHAVNGNEELILNGDIDTSGDNFITIDTGAEGGKVDVVLEGNTLVNVSKTKDTTPITRKGEDAIGNHIALVDEGSIRPVLNGNTMVNVCDQKDPVAITKSYTVETGNHVALQGEYDGKCRPVVTGNTLVNLVSSMNSSAGSILEGDLYSINCNIDYPNVIFNLAYNLKPGNTYTILINIKELVEGVSLYIGGTSSNELPLIDKLHTNSTGFKILPITIPNDKTDNTLLPIWAEAIGVSEGKIYISKPIILEGDYTNKEIPGYFTGLQSSFEDKVVTQEMVDVGEELAENLGKYKVDYVISREDGTVGQTKTFYLNSPLLEGDTIEQQGDNVVHVHRYKEVVLDGSSDEGWQYSVNYFYASGFSDRLNATDNPCISDIGCTVPYPVLDTQSGYGVNMSYGFRINLPNINAQNNTLNEFITWLQSNPTTVVYKLATPTYEVISQNDTILCDSYVNGHLDVDSVVPIEKVAFKDVNIYNRYLYPNIEYIVQFESDNIGITDIYLGGNRINNNPIVKGINKFTITTPNELANYILLFKGIGFNASNIVVTEATDQDFGYFSGMQSCFEDNLVTEGENAGKYEVTYKVTGKNKIDEPISMSRISKVGDKYVASDGDTRDYISLKIQSWGQTNESSTVKWTEYVTTNATSTGKYSKIFTKTKDDKYLRFANNGETKEFNIFWDISHLKDGTYTFSVELLNLTIGALEFKNFQLEEGAEATSYEPYKEYTKTLYLNSPLLEGDTIEEKDGNIYHVHRYGKSVLDGSDDEYWGLNQSLNNGSQFTWNIGGIGVLNTNSTVICGTMKSVIGDSMDDNNKIWIYNGTSFVIHDSSLSLDDFKHKLQQNPVIVVYQLAEPQYEVIQQLDTIAMPTYSSGHLDITSAVPLDKVNFLHFEEELTYLYPSTSYTVQFTSDKAITVDITLGGTQLLAQSIVAGLNKIVITTPETLVDNKLIINGVGANISEVVVTNSSRDFGYFEGMKSVGECEDLEVVSSNKNLFNTNKLEYVDTPNGASISLNNDVFTVTSRGGYTWCYHGVKLNYLKPNTVYKIKGEITSSNKQSSFRLFDFKTNGKTLNRLFETGVEFTTPLDVSKVVLLFYICTDTKCSIGEIASFSNIQIEEGNTGTDYIPHASNIQTLTHEPLRAVGDAKDRYVMVDGKWYIERNCAEVNASSLEWIDTGTENSYSHGKRYIWADSPSGSLNNNVPNVVCEDYISIAYNYYDYNGECIYVSSTRVYMYIDDTLDNFLTKNIKFIIINPQPTYEPINYNPLEVYSDITHISNNSTIPCNMIIKNHGYNMVALKENTQYTLYVDKNTTNALTYRLGDYVEINSLSKFTFTTPATLTDKTLRIDSKGAKVKDLMLIEGTPTNDSIGYFDGLKSSYECEQVTDENDVNYGKYKVTAKVVGKNLFNAKTITNYSYQINNGITPSCSSNGEVILNGTAENLYDFRVLSGNHIGGNISNNEPLYKYIHSLPNGTSLTLSNDLGFESYWALFRNGKTTYHKDTINIQIGDIVSCFIRVPLGTTLNNQVIHIQLEQGNTATEYEPYFESKQTVYLNSPLLKGDEIVWKDNKIQHYHKMNKVVLDGSDDEKLIKLSTDYSGINNISFALDNVNNISPAWSNSKAILSSTLPSIADKAWKGKREGITSDSVRIIICLNRAKLKTQDLAGFKQWLQQNPTTVIYKLAQPYYEEISPYPLKLSTKENTSLYTESNIQVTQISFNIYEETLAYLYPSTKYYVSFNADISREIVINLGGTEYRMTTQVGYNKIEITTPADTTNMLTFNGQGINIDHVKVTQQDIDEYFEGMKSVGECENNTLEIVCKNNDNSKSNIQTLTHEPLRAVEDIKDKYVLIDGKWYIERNCREMIITSEDISGIGLIEQDLNNGYERYSLSFHSMTNYRAKRPYQKLLNNSFYSQVGWKFEGECMFLNEDNSIGLILNKNRNIGNNHNKLREFLTNNPVKFIYELEAPVYELINYNPFETYADITHISTNSLIPSNMAIKNHGYNCILKPSTKYTIALNKPNGTISAKLGGSEKVDSTNSIFTITTPSTLNDNVLRLSGSGNVKDIMILEGDKTVNTPSYFEGIESGFEQEYDTEKGKYRVTARVEGNGKESSITFYLNEPLRGTGTAKDKVFIQDGKVVVQRNCGSVTFDGSEEGWGRQEDKGKFIKFSKEFIDFKYYPYGSHKLYCDTLCTNTNIVETDLEQLTLFCHNENMKELRFNLSKAKLSQLNIEGFKQWLQQNPTTVVYQLAEPVYEEAECDLSKLVLENYENSSLIFESNIPVSANIRYSGEVPVVTQAKSLSSQVDNTTLDINENIIPYMCDIDYRIVELQLMNGDTQGEGIELLGIGDIEILGNENVLFNNREDKKHNFSYDMLKRDILSQRYSKEEYQYRLDRYLLANKISDEEYKELEGLLNNGE